MRSPTHRRQYQATPEPGHDLCGFHVRIVQAGPEEFIAVVQTADGEECARSAKYMHSPHLALYNAIRAIGLGQVLAPPRRQRWSK